VEFDFEENDKGKGVNSKVLFGLSWGVGIFVFFEMTLKGKKED
jgi:hypothetical protein